MTYRHMIAAGLALSVVATPVLASGSSWSYRLKDPAWKEAQRIMKEADDREAADRAAARIEARTQAQDRDRRAEYQRRSANPRGPF